MSRVHGHFLNHWNKKQKPLQINTLLKIKKNMVKNKWGNICAKVEGKSMTLPLQQFNHIFISESPIDFELFEIADMSFFILPKGNGFCNTGAVKSQD